MAKEAFEMGAVHPEVGIAWRLWYPSTGIIWGEFGELELLPDVGSTPSDHWLRWSEVEFSGYSEADANNPLRLGMLVDGRRRLRPLKRYGTIACGILLLTALGAMLAGRMFAIRTARQLARIAGGIHEGLRPGVSDLLSG
ncbi:MAG: hypothetical protein P1V35_07125, partial [Planctomycetota bacterium]|nr:hypothetical protein [Planctomycetota bacterium]